MELWQTIISVCAGIITIVTVLEKLGIIQKFKKVDNDFSDLKRLPVQMEELQKKLLDLSALQIDRKSVV